MSYQNKRLKKISYRSEKINAVITVYSTAKKMGHGFSVLFFILGAIFFFTHSQALGISKFVSAVLIFIFENLHNQNINKRELSIALFAAQKDHLLVKDIQGKDVRYALPNFGDLDVSNTTRNGLEVVILSTEIKDSGQVLELMVADNSLEDAEDLLHQIADQMIEVWEQSESENFQ